MASRTIYLVGTCAWAKLKTPDPKYGHYSIDLYPSEKSWEIFDSSGMQLTKRTSENGEYISLRRPAQKLIKGELVDFGPPKLLDKHNEPMDKLVGNGSEVTVKVQVYDTLTKGVGHRLESVRVENLITYNPPLPTLGEVESPF